MTPDWLEAQLGMLSALRGIPDDTRGYFEALRDIPETLIRRAMARALKTRTFFPTPAEIRQDCDAVNTDRRADYVMPAAAAPVDLNDPQVVRIKNIFGGKDIFVRVEQDWLHDCQICLDTGWSEFWCGQHISESSPLSRRRCERPFGHGPHAYVEPCPCIETNPTIQRRKQARTNYSEGGKR